MTLEFKDKDGNVVQTIKDEGIVSRPGTRSPTVKLEVTVNPCKHDWRFIGESSRLRCERCGQETGPRTPDQLAEDLLKDIVTIGSAWSKGGERIDPLSVYAVPTDKLPMSIANLKPDYNITFHNHHALGGVGKMVGKLDFNGPELVFTGDAAESAKVFIDWVATTFHGRLQEERQKELDACCDLLEGMHAATTGSHNYYLHAAVELRRLRKGENNGQR